MAMATMCEFLIHFLYISVVNVVAVITANLLCIMNQHCNRFIISIRDWQCVWAPADLLKLHTHWTANTEHVWKALNWSLVLSDDLAENLSSPQIQYFHSVHRVLFNCCNAPYSKLENSTATFKISRHIRTEMPYFPHYLFNSFIYSYFQDFISWYFALIRWLEVQRECRSTPLILFVKKLSVFLDGVQCQDQGHIICDTSLTHLVHPTYI